jgi:drug/metabolite transporter (DMT)-like permease
VIGGDGARFCWQGALAMTTTSSDTIRMAPKPHATRPRAVDLVLLLTLASCWAASYTFIKIGVATIPPVTLIAARTVLASVLLLALMRARGIRLPGDGATWRHFMVQSCLSAVAPFLLIAWAEQTVDAGLATILNATTPIFAFLFTWAISRHEAVSSRKLFGVIVGLAGICFIIGLDALSGLGRDVLGQLAVVAASACYGMAVIFGRRFNTLDPMIPALGSLLCGAFVLVPLSLVVDRPWTLAPAPSSLLAVAGLAVISTALALVIYFRLLRTLGSVGTTSQAYLRAPIGVAFGIVFLGESLAPSAALGLACVIIGVAAMNLPARRGARAEAPAPTAIAR